MVVMSLHHIVNLSLGFYLLTAIQVSFLLGCEILKKQRERKDSPFACVTTSLKDTIKQTDCLNLLFKVHFGIDFGRCYATVPKYLFDG